MNKVLLLLFLTSTAKFVFGQLQIPFDTTTKKVSYTEIVYVDSVSAKELFVRTVDWITQNYKSTNVIKVKDEERGRIIAKGFLTKIVEVGIMSKPDMNVYHTLAVDLKNGKCKVQVTDLTYTSYYSSPENNSEEVGKNKIEELISDLSIKKNYPNKSDWLDFIKKCDKVTHAHLDSFSQYLQTPVKGDKDNFLTVSQVVKVDSASKSELYSRGKAWAAKAFFDAKTITMLDDKENGIIILKPSIPATTYNPLGIPFDAGHIKYSLQIEFKDGKYKYTISNVYHDSGGQNGILSGGSLSNEKPECGYLNISKYSWTKMQKLADYNLKDLVNSLTTDMQKSIRGTDSDW